MGYKRAGLRIALLLLGLLLLYVAGRILDTQLSRPGFSDDEIQLIRRLAASEDPGLAEVLDRSWFIPYGDAAQGQDQSRCSARNSSHGAHGDVRSGFRCARSVLEGTP